MSQWRNVSNDERGVVYGNPVPRWVTPDGVVKVDDDADVAYAHQGDVWGAADDGAKAAVAALTPAPAPVPAEVPSAPVAPAAPVSAPVTPAPDVAALEAKVAADEVALASAEIPAPAA